MRKFLVIALVVLCAVIIVSRMRRWDSRHAIPAFARSQALAPSSRPLDAGTPRRIAVLTNRAAVSTIRNAVSTNQATVSTNRPPRVDAPVAPDWTRLPANICLICGQCDSKDYMARMTAIHQLGLHLSADEVHALYWLLRQKYLSQGDLSQESFAALKNDVLDALIRQQPVPPDLGQEIVGMYRDHATDPLWRDYCVQHFAMYYGRMWSKSDMEGGTSPAPAAATSSSAAASRFPDDPDRNDILSAFDEALLEKDNGIAGTALLGLYSLASGGYAEVAATAIGDKALAMALDETCAVPTRITAIGICGLTGKAEVLPVARILAQTSDVLPLRLSSIATIGALGATQDLELLEGLRAGKDERLYKAINGSLKKLRQRGIAGP